MSAVSEAMRYMRCEDVPEIREKTEMTMARLREISEAGYVFKVFPIVRSGDEIELKGSGVVFRSESAEKMLGQCHSAALMLCSLGFGFEAELRKAQVRSMADAVILDACGSALVEEGCDKAEREIAALLPDSFLTDRFSPGYGDLPLELQEQILTALNGEKLLGVHLNESLLFYPGKTVSAVIGISDKKQPARIRGCDYCSMRDSCALRKRGGSCGK